MKREYIFVLTLAVVMIVGANGLFAVESITVPYHRAHAATLGEIVSSSSIIGGSQTLQISVSDADLAGVAAHMPRVTLASSAPGIGLQWYNGTDDGGKDTDSAFGPNFYSQGSSLGLYQAAGGAWIGYVTINSTGTAPVPINNPAQDSTSPGAVSSDGSNFANAPNFVYVEEPSLESGQVLGSISGGHGTGITTGTSDPPVKLSQFVFNLTTTRVTGDFVIRVATADQVRTTVTRGFVLGDTITFTYNDVSPARAVSTTVTVGHSQGDVAFDGGEDSAGRNTPPELLNPIVAPASGDNSTEFIFNVTYRDKENQRPYPKPVEVIIDGTAFGMREAVPADNFFGDGKNYTFSTRLSVGNHTFSFTASDGTDTVSTTQFQLNVLAITRLPLVISKVEILDIDGNPKSAFAPEETLLASITIQNTGTLTKELLLAVQLLDPELTIFPPSITTLSLDSGQEFTFTTIALLPSNAKTGSWSVEAVVFSDLPSEGGEALGQPRETHIRIAPVHES